MPSVVFFDRGLTYDLRFCLSFDLPVEQLLNVAVYYLHFFSLSNMTSNSKLYKHQ